MQCFHGLVLEVFFLLLDFFLDALASLLSFNHAWFSRGLVFIHAIDFFACRMNALINSCKVAGRHDLCLRYLNQMHNQGIEPTLQTLHLCIHACGMQGDYNNALSLLNGMRSAYNLVPVTTTFNVTILALRESGKIDMIFDLLDKMDTQCAKNHNTYQFSLHALADKGMWKEALSVVSKMEEASGIRPDARCYSIVIMACTNAQQWEAALKILQYIKDEGLRLSYSHYLAALNACAVCGK